MVFDNATQKPKEIRQLKRLRGERKKKTLRTQVIRNQDTKRKLRRSQTTQLKRQKWHSHGRKGPSTSNVSNGVLAQPDGDYAWLKSGPRPPKKVYAVVERSRVGPYGNWLKK